MRVGLFFKVEGICFSSSCGADSFRRRELSEFGVVPLGFGVLIRAFLVRRKNVRNISSRSINAASLHRRLLFQSSLSQRLRISFGLPSRVWCVKPLRNAPQWIYNLLEDFEFVSIPLCDTPRTVTNKKRQT